LSVGTIPPKSPASHAKRPAAPIPRARLSGTETRPSRRRWRIARRATHPLHFRSALTECATNPLSALALRRLQPRIPVMPGIAGSLLTIAPELAFTEGCLRREAVNGYAISATA